MTIHHAIDLLLYPINWALYILYRMVRTTFIILFTVIALNLLWTGHLLASLICTILIPIGATYYKPQRRKGK